MGNKLQVLENGTELAKNERPRGKPFPQFYKGFERFRKFKRNGIETSVHKFF